MNEPARIADQLHRAVEGDAWHGPALKEVLKDVSAKTAAAKPIPGAHSIWELVLHMAVCTEAVCKRLQGDKAELTEANSWPPVAASTEAAWKAALDRLWNAHPPLFAAIAKLDAARLDEPVVPGSQSAYINLHGLVQHHLYHAGQIALLKKAAESHK
jgi:uncharacterized damage-inducible protein DinB